VFGCVGFLASVRGARVDGTGWGWVRVSWCCIVLATLSKEPGIALLGVVVVYDALYVARLLDAVDVWDSIVGTSVPQGKRTKDTVDGRVVVGGERSHVSSLRPRGGVSKSRGSTARAEAAEASTSYGAFVEGLRGFYWRTVCMYVCVCVLCGKSCVC